MSRDLAVLEAYFDDEQGDLLGLEDKVDDPNVHDDRDDLTPRGHIIKILAMTGKDNKKCQKCALFSGAISPFMRPTWWIDGVWGSEVPSDAELQNRSWVVIIGDPPDPKADMNGNLGVSVSAMLVGAAIEAILKRMDERPKNPGVLMLPILKCRPGFETGFLEKIHESKMSDAVTDLIRNPDCRIMNPDKGQIKRCFTSFVEPLIEHIPNLAGVMGFGSSAAGIIAKNAYATSTVMRSFQYQIGERMVPSGVIQDTGWLVTSLESRWPEFVNHTAFQMRRFYRDRSKDVEAALPAGFECVISLTIDDIIEWFTPLLKGVHTDKPLAWDCETSSLHHFKSGFGVGLIAFYHPSQPKPMVVVTPAYNHYPEVLSKRENSPWSDASDWVETYVPKMLSGVKFLMESESVIKIGHNIAFDELSVYAAFKWDVKGFHHDTMIQEYIMDPDVKGLRGLDNMCQKYLTDMPPYWIPMDRYRRDKGIDNFMDIPPNLLIPYAAYDAYVTYLLHEKVTEELKSHPATKMGGFFVRPGGGGDWTFGTYTPVQYCQHVRKIHHRVCRRITAIGQHIDLELTSMIHKKYHTSMEAKRRELEDDEAVRKFESESLIHILKPNHAQVKAFKKDPDGSPLRVNWASVNQVRALFIGFLGMEVKKKTEKGNPSIDESVMKEYALVSETAKRLLRWRVDAKFITSFLNPILTNDPSKSVLHSDRMVHSNFACAKIGTGRLSSSRPNVQAIPRDGDVKRIYASRYPDGWIVTRDYSGIEVRVLAMLSRDEKLIEVYSRGDGDVHMETQRKFFGDKADKKNKSQRSICKQALFGQIYGQGDRGLFELLTLNEVKDPDTGNPISYEQCQAFNTMLSDHYKGVQNWVQASHQLSVHTHYVTSAFGFVRRLPILKEWGAYLKVMSKKSRERGYRDRKLVMEIKEALRVSQNASIQSTASDFTVLAANRIMDEFERQGVRAVVYNIVHDDIWSDVQCSDDVPIVSRIMADVMDNIASWLPEYLPDFDTTWMDVPVIGEAEVGLSPKDCYPIIVEPSSFDPSKVMSVKVPKAVASDALGKEVESDMVIPFLENEKAIRFHLKLTQSSFAN